MIEKSATIADTHVRTYTWASRPRIIGDAIHAVTYFFDYCLEHKCSAKFLGDIFHTLTPLPEFVKPLFDKITEMQEAGLPVYYIQGNHDLNKVPWLSLHPWPINLDRVVKELPECGMRVAGRQSVGRDELLEFFESLDESVDTLLLHQSEEKVLPFSAQFKLDEVPTHIKNVLIGDIHNPQDYVNKSGTRLWYPGSPYVTSLDNIEDRSFLVESVVDGETVIGRVPVPGRKFYHFQVDKPQDPEALETDWMNFELNRIEQNIFNIAEHDLRHGDLEPVIIIEYPPECSERAYQKFMPLRESLGVYTWLSVTGELNTGEEEYAIGDVSQSTVNMDEIIDQNVHEEVPREILKKIFQGNDIQEVLQAELEERL